MRNLAVWENKGTRRALSRPRYEAESSTRLEQPQTNHPCCQITTMHACMISNVSAIRTQRNTKHVLLTTITGRIQSLQGTISFRTRCRGGRGTMNQQQQIALHHDHEDTTKSGSISILVHEKVMIDRCSQTSFVC